MANLENSISQNPLSKKSQSRWHLIYYWLAAFDLLVILFSLFLNHQLTGIYNQSVQINSEWAARLGQYAELNRLASAVNAPGNDVFDSANVAAESKKLEAALKSFYEAIDDARDNLNRNVEPEEREILFGDLAEILTETEGMKAEASLIFSYFNKGETRKAGERMATMDRQYAKVNVALSKLNRHVHEIQSVHIENQGAAARSLARFEYVIFGVVIFIIGGVIAYGRKLSRQIKSSQHEIDEHMAALQASEGLFKSISESSPVGIFQADVKGNCFYSNKRLQQLSGYGLEESIGEGWKRAIHPDDLQMVTEMLKCSFAEKRHFSHEFRLLTPSGQIRWVHSRCKPLFSDFGKLIGYIGTVEDISERKLTEQRLKLQYAVTSVLAEATSRQDALTGILQSVCENAGWEIGTVWSVDPHGHSLSCIAIKHTGSYNFAEFEVASREMVCTRGVGLPGQVWLSGQPAWIDGITEENFLRASCAIGCGLHTAFAFPVILRNEIIGVIEFFSVEIRQPEESTLDLLNSIGSQIGQFIERKRTEEALKKSEEHVRLIIDTALDAVITIDSSGVVTEWNTQAEKMFGWNRKEATGQKLSEMIIPHHHREAHEQGMKRYLATEEGHILNRRFEITALHRNGEEFPIELAIAPVWSGNDVSFSAFIRDITERKRFEETIRESEERFRSAIDHAPIGMAIVALNGHFIQVNRSLCEILGYTESELLFTDFQSITHPDDLEMDLNYVRRMIEGEINTYQMEKRYFHKSGRIVWTLLSASLIHDRKGDPLYFIAQIQDITERKEADEKLRLNEALLSTVIDSTPDWIFIKDRNHRYLLANQSYASPLNLSPQEFVGKTDIDLGFPEDIVKGNAEKGIRGFWADDREVMESGKTKFIEEEPAIINGRELILSTVKVPLKDASGWVWGVLGFVHDITARKQAEERLRKSEEKFRALLESASEAILTANKAGQITLINAKAEKIFGYSREEIVGQPVEVLLPEQFRHQHHYHQKDFFLTPHKGAMSKAKELCGRRKNGEEFPAEISLSYVKSGEDSIAMAFISDITQRRQTEVQLREAKESAESANRAKSEFLANMSHEIRTPMNAVIGMTGLLLDTDLSSDQQEFVEVIRTSSDALLTVINDILDFSKIESGKLDLERHPFDLRDSIEESLDLLATKASEKNLNLAYTIDSQVPGTIVGDSTRLRQIFVNLINNAVKFTQLGEIVLSVSARPLFEEETLNVSFSDYQSSLSGTLYELHCVVEDTGIGIPQDKMGALFQSFTQVDASTTRIFGGTGLGLAISKRLTEMMGGTMWVESELGKGSKFHFTIKATAAPSQTRIYLKSSQPELRERRLLIVDDNSANRRILELQAESWGMKPCVASSGQQALEWISRGDLFDVAILDMQMPEMDGLQLATEIRKMRTKSELPMIMLTSVGKRAREDQEENFSVFLTKPIKPSQLYDALIGLFTGNASKRLKPATSKRGFRVLSQQNPLKILLVEDNIVNQKVALRILERMGYRADVAGNGIEAIQALERQHYDVALMDVQMPEMDGLTATREICRRWSRAERPRIIAMTANAMQGDSEECMAAGMDDYVSKPVDIEELVAALERSSKDVPANENHQNVLEEILDISVLASVFSFDDRGDREAVEELINIYFEDAAQQLSQLEEKIEFGDAQGTRQIAHAMKGGSSSLGARRMAELSNELEHIACKGSLNGAKELLYSLKVEFESLRQVLTSGALLRERELS
jgi:PAS domain S-box-containing protein